MPNPISQGLNSAGHLARVWQGDRTASRAVFANSGWLLVDKLCRASLGLIVGAWVARHLGPSQFGLLAYVLAYVAIFQAIANLGADAIVVRDIAQDKGAAPHMLGSAFAIRLFLGAVCWFGAVAIVGVSSRGDHQIMTLTAIVSGVLLFQSADVIDLWFQSQSQSRRTVVAKLAAYLVSNGAKVTLIMQDAPLLAFAAITVFEAAASAFALAVAYRHFSVSHRWTFDARAARGLVGEAWPFMLSGVAIMMYMRVDQLMVKELLGAHELGIYAAALPISQFWQVLPMTLATSLAPFVARQRQSDERAYLRTMVLIFRAFFYGGILAAAITYCVSGPLVRHLFGAQFAGAIPILDAHSISNIFCFLGVAHNLWLINERRFAVRLWGTMLAGLSTVALNLALLPSIGLIGACYAAIVAQFIAAFLINGLLDRRSFVLQLQAILLRKA